MKISISYFYKIRFFKSNMIPMSTAISDPAWYHDNCGSYHSFIDKNGVLNGLRFKDFMPIIKDNGECYGQKSCKELDKQVCGFLNNYYEQLSALSFEEVVSKLEKIALATKSVLGFE